MRFTIIALGTRGDVQPYLALGLGLQSTGHQVRIGSFERFRHLISSYGIDFAPIYGDPLETMQGKSGKSLLKTRHNAFALARRTIEAFSYLMEQGFIDTRAACTGADAVIFSGLGYAGYHIAEHMHIPSFAALTQPLVPSRYFPSLAIPPTLQLGPLFNSLSHEAVERLYWSALRDRVNYLREDVLGLPPIARTSPMRRMHQQRVPMLVAVSPVVFPKPRDWAHWVQVTGYWYLDQHTSWSPPNKLLDFLRSGPAPICVSFGSLPIPEASELTAKVVGAIRATGQRGILLTGWGGLTEHLDDDIYAIDEVPHDWLFPQVAAVIHHGGAGTTGACFRAGSPSIVVPHFADQPFWGQLVYKLGVGARPVRRDRFLQDRLVRAIDDVTSDIGIGRRSRELAQSIGQEDGVAAAVLTIEEHLAV